MLQYFRTIIGLPGLFVELMESYELADEAKAALDALLALAED